MKAGQFVSRKSLEERFWEKVNKNGPTPRPDLGPCWVWTAATNQRGYGQFVIAKGHQEAASRVALFLVDGVWPMCALHRCDNPPCVKNVDDTLGPSHLFGGTTLDNSNDKVAKNRQAKGVNHGLAKLTPELAEAIKLDRSNGMGQVALSIKYGVSRTSVRNVLSGKTWRS
jgi:hypothetical protein